MTAAAGRKVDALTAQQGEVTPLAASGPAYEPGFLMSLEPALEDLEKYGIRIAANAGGADVTGCAKVVEGMIKKKGLGLKVRFPYWEMGY